MSTYFPSGAGLAENRKWFVVDAAGQTVGRLATEIA
ncbi:MAG: 50S ribosomal protein L13, partial [Pyrinomonadaceae bacterium]